MTLKCHRITKDLIPKIYFKFIILPFSIFQFMRKLCSHTMIKIFLQWKAPNSYDNVHSFNLVSLFKIINISPQIIFEIKKNYRILINIKKKARYSVWDGSNDLFCNNFCVFKMKKLLQGKLSLIKIYIDINTFTAIMFADKTMAIISWVFKLYLFKKLYIF